MKNQSPGKKPHPNQSPIIWTKTSGFSLRASELLIIGGRPSMGKTALAMNAATHISSGADKTVIGFSAEKLPPAK